MEDGLSVLCSQKRLQEMTIELFVYSYTNYNCFQSIQRSMVDTWSWNRSLVFYIQSQVVTLNKIFDRVWNAVFSTNFSAKIFFQKLIMQIIFAAIFPIDIFLIIVNLCQRSKVSVFAPSRSPIRALLNPLKLTVRFPPRKIHHHISQSQLEEIFEVSRRFSSYGSWYFKSR